MELYSSVPFDVSSLKGMSGFQATGNGMDEEGGGGGGSSPQGPTPSPATTGLVSIPPGELSPPPLATL